MKRSNAYSCPSDRAVKQLKALSRFAAGGGRAFLVFIAAIPETAGG